LDRGEGAPVLGAPFLFTQLSKFHARFGELLDYLSAKGYQFVRVDQLLEPK
jgi:hypothetical protein